MADEITPLISKEDIQDLVIEKKFVRIDSNRYTEEAYEYVKQLIDAERAILFDRSTHRIWTLGEWFGGDVFKENLLYYSRLKVIDLDDELLSEVEAISPESTLAYRGKNGININVSHDEENSQDILEFDFDVYNLVRYKPGSKYSLYIDDEGKIDIQEYHEPNINIIKQDYNPNNITIDLEFEIDSVIPFKEWKNFNINTENCELVNVDDNNQIIKININPDNYVNDIPEIVKITYDDGYTKKTITFNGIFNIYCYYGNYDQDNFDYIELGNYIIEDNKIDYIFQINQGDYYYGYYRCPIKYDPLFIDNRRYSQGAWREGFNSTINGITYKTYITDNPGLGNNEWKVLENIK